MALEKECLVEIKKISKKGLGVGISSSFSKEIEIPKVFIGEKVLAKIFKKKQGIHQGSLLAFQEKHPMRVSPLCPHSDICGGCSWQQLAYQEQLKLKQERIEQLFKSLAPEVSVGSICSIKDPVSFRNKMEFTFFETKQGEQSLGLIQTGSKGWVVDIASCAVCPSWMSEVLGAVKNWWKGTSLAAYHRLRHTGTLHLLTLREGFHTKEKMVILTVCGEPTSSLGHQELESFKKALLSVRPDLTSLFLQIKQIKEGSPTTSSEMLIYGKDHIEEHLYLSVPNQKGEKKLSFKVSPASFFQPCTLQAEKLLSFALGWFASHSLETVLDLYCGTATFGMAFSFLAQKVIGVELNPYAVYDAEVNIEKNRIGNLEVHCSDVKHLADVAKERSGVDLVIVDPPRAGLGIKAIDDVFLYKPSWILYVSCNPFTQVEDVKVFLEKGYEVKNIQPLDQFAHTPHVENLVLLKKRV